MNTPLFKETDLLIERAKLALAWAHEFRRELERSLTELRKARAALRPTIEGRSPFRPP